MSRRFSAVVVAASLLFSGLTSGAILVHHDPSTPAAGQAALGGRTCFVVAGAPACPLIPCREFVDRRLFGVVLSSPVPGSRRCGSPPSSSSRNRPTSFLAVTDRLAVVVALGDRRGRTGLGGGR